MIIYIYIEIFLYKMKYSKYWLIADLIDLILYLLTSFYNQNDQIYHLRAFVLSVRYAIVSICLAKIIFVNLFLLLFMDLTVFFGTIYGFHYIILVNFYLYLQYFQQNFFNFYKISESSTSIKMFIRFAIQTFSNSHTLL